MNTLTPKLKSLDKDAAKAAFVFLLKTAGVYAAWKLFTALMENVPSLSVLWEGFRNQVGSGLAQITKFVVCDIIGYNGAAYGRVFFIEGTNGIAIKNSCIGISAMVLFAGLIAVYPGKWKHKLWYIPLGVLLVQASNIFRLVGLAIMQKHSSEAFVQFNHGYTYLIITYSFIFILVMYWMNKWAERE